VKKLFLCGAAALALVACSGERKDAKTETGATTPTANSEQAKPELGDWGVETQDIDASTKPGDDFYRYVNGGWLDTFKIPDEFSSYGSFTVLFERSEERVKKIIEDAAGANAAAGSNESKIGDFFNAYADTDAINSSGLEPLKADFDYIDSLASVEDVARAMARPNMGNAPIGAFIDVDAKKPDRYIVYITQAGLGMPNRDYYLEAKFADKQAKYRAYIAQILNLVGIDGAEAKAAAIYDVEHQMAEVEWAPDKRRQRELTYNLKTLEELKAFAPEAPWDAMLASSGLQNETEFVVREYDAIQNLGKIIAATPIDVWKAYLKFHLVNAYAGVLPAEIDDANFAFFGTELTGTPKQKERWKRGVAAVNGAMGEAVGKIYVERHFPPESKAKMQALVDNLGKALDERLTDLAWMSEATKVEAHKKLAKFTPKIAYPDVWRDYSKLKVEPGDAYGNAKRANEFAWDYSISRLGGPIIKTEWGMTPQTVNAYYSANRNEIVFPAAILQAPFFDPNADPAVNYGGIGAVIGHEIGHGFDDQGRKSDGDGFLRDWWTEEDGKKFQALADKLGAQYETYEPIPGFPVNPKLTMGENIGDIGGLAMAYHAYKLSLNGQEAPVIDGLTGDQRFFLAWGQVWKRVVREEQLKNQIAADPHSPAQYRVNGVVRNMDAWYEAFGVTPESALYLAPEDRVQIW
jgi:predicted metalloendopeptidase